MTLIFFIILAIAIFGVMLVSSLIRGVTSFIFGKPSSSTFSGYHQPNGSHTNSNGSQYNNTKEHHRKVFSKDEGEYVKFEEIKE